MKLYDFELTHHEAEIEGSVKVRDTSFTHAFGTKKESDLEVWTISVYVRINGISYNIYDALSDSEKEYFRGLLLDHAQNELRAGGAA